MTIRNSKIHGRGVFAKTDIPKGARIIEYVGEKISKKEADIRGPRLVEEHKKNRGGGAVYLFELNNRSDIDGNVPYNTARFINHSCEPNAETEIKQGKIWIVSIRDIQKGKEIFYNYGYGLDDFLEHPCSCGTPSCPGFIAEEEMWPKLRRKLKKIKLKNMNKI